MRITARIATFVVVWTLLVLAVSGLLRLRRDLDLVEGDLLRACALVGALMTDDVAAAYAAGGRRQAQERATDLTAHEDQIQVQVVPLDLTQPEQAAHVLEVASWRSVEPATFRDERADDEGEDAALRVLVALPAPAQAYALELRASLAQQREIRHRALLDFLVLAALVSAVAAWFSTVGGATLVGRRVDALIALSRAAARGAPAPALPAGHNDELDALADEMRAMHAELAEARRNRERDASERARLREQLHHVDRLATAGLMVARIAHEVGTPLGVVLGRLRRLQRAVADNPGAQREAHVALEQVERIEQVMSHMLAYARRQPQEGGCDAVAAARQAFELVASIGRDHRLGLHVRLPTPARSVRGDRLGLEQVIVNLLVNAIQHSPSGSTIDVTIEPSTGSVGEGVAIQVADRGHGLDVEQGQLFEAFFTTRGAEGGTGLGLAIVKSLVEDRGGQVRARAREGGGACFVVDLPFSDVGPAAASGQPDPVPGPAQAGPSDLTDQPREAST